ncbi:MAG: hypothetical protein ACTHLE_18995 [Agriterribacter sp.]
MKVFEVGNDRVWGNAPVSKTSLRINKWDSVNAEIIPVVFLKNEVLHHISKVALDSLADNVNHLCRKILQERFERGYSEIQIDCDWTQSTKDSYFYFLKKLKILSGKAISVTLRLYPYKYPDKMGIPPADRATLMCYNLVNALENQSKNSILEINELRQYLSKNRKYPIHLDIALPAYSWMLVYQNGQFRGVISQQNENIITKLELVKPLWYEVFRDTVIDEYYLRRGDKIKYETVSPVVLQQAIELIKSSSILDDSVIVSIFHLDEHKLNNFSYETLDSVYTAFGK